MTLHMPGMTCGAPIMKADLSVTGFPRKLDQAYAFEERIVPSAFTLFYDCPEDVMQERLINRGKTSGRADDNAESIKKRFKTFIEQSMPVVEYYAGQNKVEKISATTSPEEVYAETQTRLAKRGIKAMS